MTTIYGSRIHHFEDQGIWIYGIGLDGCTVDSSTVERGEDLGQSKGLTLVRLDEADELRFTRNKLDLSTLVTSNTSSAALDVYFGLTFCGTASGQTDSLVVRKNWILGPGTSASGTRRGIRAFWLCGSSDRKILFDENYIEDFADAGLEVNQSANAIFTCNTVVDVERALDFYRDNKPSGLGVRFKNNWLEVKTGGWQAIRTDDNTKTHLGPSQASPPKGDNGFLVEDQDVDFIEEDDPDGGDKLNAKDNYWYLYNTSADTESLIDDSADYLEIANRISPNSVDVQFQPFYESDSSATYCRATSPPTGGASAFAGVAVSVVESDRRRGRQAAEAGTLIETDVPQKTYLRVIGGGSPGGRVGVELGIATSDAGPVTVDVYNVTGRRVARLLEGALRPGTFRLQWDGRAASGGLVASGVYFVRLRGVASVHVGKLVLLR